MMEMNRKEYPWYRSFWAMLVFALVISMIQMEVSFALTFLPNSEGKDIFFKTLNIFNRGLNDTYIITVIVALYALECNTKEKIPHLAKLNRQVFFQEPTQGVDWSRRLLSIIAYISLKLHSSLPSRYKQIDYKDFLWNLGQLHYFSGDFDHKCHNCEKRDNWIMKSQNMSELGSLILLGKISYFTLTFN